MITMSDTINGLVETAIQELVARHRGQLEKAIEFAIRENCDGQIPALHECAARGKVVRVVSCSDEYTEFQWDGKAQFRQRVRFNETGHHIDVRIDYVA